MKALWTPLLKKDDSISKKRFTPAFVAALVVAAVLGTIAVQHVAAPREAPLSDPRISMDLGRVGSSRIAAPSSHEHDEPSVDQPEFEYHIHDEDQLSLGDRLGSALKYAASLGGCGDKKVSGCLTHYKKSCGWLMYDDGCAVCKPGYDRDGKWKCNKCKDKSVSGCLLPHKSECGGLWYDNGKCETCMADYEAKGSTKCEKCKDKSVDNCLMHEKAFCGTPSWIPYDSGKCAACLPGCERQNKKTKCNCEFWEEQWDAVKEDPLGYASDRIDDIGDALDELNDHIEDAINMLKSFFNGMECDVDGDVMMNMFNSFADSLTVDFSSILEVFKGKQDDFVKGLGGPLCDYIWTTGITSASVVLDAVNAVVEMIGKHCPALQIDTGSKVPIVTIGFTLDAGVESPTGRTASAGLELGIGFTLRGDKVCYVGGCVEEGFKVQVVPDPPFGVDASMAVSLFKDISNVPGDSTTITLGAGVDIPSPVNLGADFVATMIVSGDEIIGLSMDLGAEPSSGTPDLELSFAQGICLTPRCVTTDGNHCSDQYPVEESKEVAEVVGDEAAAKYEEKKANEPPSPPSPSSSSSSSSSTSKKVKKIKNKLG